MNTGDKSTDPQTTASGATTVITSKDNALAVEKQLKRDRHNAAIERKYDAQTRAMFGNETPLAELIDKALDGINDSDLKGQAGVTGTDGKDMGIIGPPGVTGPVGLGGHPPGPTGPVARKLPAPGRPRKGRLRLYVYTIAKNELQFCERFAKSCEDADGVYVLDTGSTDGTPEKLQSLGCNVEVVPFDKWKTLEEYDRLTAEGKNPWRFDVSRNLSIDMCPEDADVLVCIDLDEVLVPGWRKIVEEAWTPGANHMSYLFAWSMDGDKPRHCFWYEKFHARHGFIWADPVHEAICPTHGTVDRRVFRQTCLVQHYPDGTKPRTQYLPLLELGVRESPTNTRIRFYLGREYTFTGRWQDAINTHTHLLSMPNANCTRERSNACIQVAACYGKLRDIAAAKHADEAARKADPEVKRCEREQFHYLLKAIMEEPGQREAWVELSDYCRISGDNLLGYWAAKKALSIPENAKDNNYLVNPDDWTYRPHDLAGIMSWYVGDIPFKQESLQESWKTLELCPFNDHFGDNYRVVQSCLAKPYVKPTAPLIDVMILAYSKTAALYQMCKGAIASLRASSPDVPFRVMVIETNKKLAEEPFAQADKDALFGPDVRVVYPPGPFGVGAYLQHGYALLDGVTKYIMFLNNDVTLFNSGFLSKLLVGLRDASSVSPLGLREATWNMFDRNIPLIYSYDVNIAVNGWCLTFDRRILKAIPFDKLFPTSYIWYQCDILYGQLLQEYGYKHALVTAAQCLHLQGASHNLLGDGMKAPKDRVALLGAVGIRGKRVVEVGVHLGDFAKEILKYGPAHLLLVDPWKHQDASIYPDDGCNTTDEVFETRYQSVCEITRNAMTPCEVMREFSVQAAAKVPDSSVDFVYIDAIHTKKAAKEDAEAWWPKVKPGGWLCGHDYQAPGVASAVREFIAEHKLTLACQTGEPMVYSWVIQKRVP